jgi:hypothetical protein
MKKPREILLERHQAANVQLDRIRRTALEELSRQATKTQRWPASLVALFLGGSQKFWRELLWPHPAAWTALAGVWLVIFGVQLASREALPQSFARQLPPSPQMRELLKQQEQMFAELVGPKENREADRPKSVAPQPRSSRREEIQTV